MSEPAVDPQGLMRVLVQAMEEVLGAEAMRSVLGAAGMPLQLEEIKDRAAIAMLPGALLSESSIPADPISRVLQALERVYGSKAGQGVAQRIGRACFQYGLRDYGDRLGFTDTSFRLLPLPAKLKRFANGLAGFLNGPMQQDVRIEQADGTLLWHMGNCPLCRERHAEAPVCQLAVGLAEEALYWLSGGKIFSIEEVTCVARGDPDCTLRVNETPLS